MVIIHLAKMSLLEKSCDYFQNALIPQAVHDEMLIGKEKGYADAALIEDLVRARKLVVKPVKDHRLLRRTRELNIQRGEAEALALCWQEHATYLASDDDAVRKKRLLLGVRLIGTLAIVLQLYRARVIHRPKLRDSVTELRKLGWFSSAVIDHMLMEAE